MPTRRCLIGLRFGRLKVVSDAPDRKVPSGTRRMENCICDCGNTTLNLAQDLTSGTTRSCGCLSKDTVIARSLKHGHARRLSRSPTYSSWADMIKRCYDQSHSTFASYGAKGISVCERWRSFSLFLIDMGPRPPLTSIDRIDNSGNYEPGNCRWATASQQCRNRKSNHLFCVNGVTGCLAELSEIFGINSAAVMGRLRMGWSVEKSFTAPLRKQTRR